MKDIENFEQALQFFKENENLLNVDDIIHWNHMIMADYPDSMLIQFANTLKRQIEQ